MGRALVYGTLHSMILILVAGSVVSHSRKMVPAFGPQTWRDGQNEAAYQGLLRPTFDAPDDEAPVERCLPAGIACTPQLRVTLLAVRRNTTLLSLLLVAPLITQ